MSLQRRLLLALLVCAPLVWAVTVAVSVVHARHEVNELYDTQMVHLARQLLAAIDPQAVPRRVPPPLNAGEAEVGEMAITVRGRDGRLLAADADAVDLPAAPPGFADLTVGPEPWRVYTQAAPDGSFQVAVGQQAEERDELVLDLILSQLLPWLAMLPLLLAAMAWAVRRALAPMTQMTQDLGHRHADDLRPLDADQAPTELQPMVRSLNRLFGRIEQTLAHERRFTADAAHELRTPLAVLRAQWDVLRRETDPARRDAAERKLGSGLERAERLVAQMLALTRVEASDRAALGHEPVSWPPIVEQAMSDCLALAGRRRIELACDWPEVGAPLPLSGDAGLLAVMLRNLIDNAARYAAPGTTVLLRFSHDRVEIENDGPGFTPELLARPGERFQRPPGQAETGSGLGLSIVSRIAELHGLALSVENREGGVRVTLSAARS